MYTIYNYSHTYLLLLPLATLLVLLPQVLDGSIPQGHGGVVFRACLGLPHYLHHLIITKITIR